MDKKVILIIIALLLIFALVYFLFLIKEEVPSEVPEATSQPEITPPAATGNISDLVEALEKELSDENLVLEEENNDINLIISDSQEISDFGQTAHEDDL